MASWRKAKKDFKKKMLSYKYPRFAYFTKYSKNAGAESNGWAFYQDFSKEEVKKSVRIHRYQKHLWWLTKHNKITKLDELDLFFLYRDFVMGWEHTDRGCDNG